MPKVQKKAYGQAEAAYKCILSDSSTLADRRGGKQQGRAVFAGSKGRLCFDPERNAPRSMERIGAVWLTSLMVKLTRSRQASAGSPATDRKTASWPSLPAPSPVATRHLQRKPRLSLLPIVLIARTGMPTNFGRCRTSAEAAMLTTSRRSRGSQRRRCAPCRRSTCRPGARCTRWTRVSPCRQDLAQSR